MRKLLISLISILIAAFVMVAAVCGVAAFSDFFSSDPVAANPSGSTANNPNEGNGANPNTPPATDDDIQPPAVDDETVPPVTDSDVTQPPVADDETEQPSTGDNTEQQPSIGDDNTEQPSTGDENQGSDEEAEPAGHTHSPLLIPFQAATCQQSGHNAHYFCYGCNTYFADYSCSTEIDPADYELPQVAHSYNSNDVCIWCGIHESTAGLKYEEYTDHAILIGMDYSVTATEIYIASTYNEKPVTEIKFGVFGGRDNIVKVVIPDGVTTIGAKAFDHCDNLTTVEIPDSVTYIASDAFRDCPKLWEQAGGVYYVGNFVVGYTDTVANVTIREGTKGLVGRSVPSYESLMTLASVSIPASVTYIGNGAFKNAVILATVTIAEGVTTIEEDAFNWCRSLRNINIPNSVTTIGMSAFYGCTNLRNITIPNSVTSIGSQAFAFCSNMTSITLSGNLTYIASGIFSGCSVLTNITFNGTKEAWAAIPKDYFWNTNTAEFTITCINGTLTKSQA